MKTEDSENIHSQLPEANRELREAALPLIKYLNEKYHPHTTVIVTTTSVELLESVVSVPEIFDYVKD